MMAVILSAKSFRPDCEIQERAAHSLSAEVKMKPVRILQALLVLLALLAYVMAVYAVELFGLQPIFSIPGLAVVVSILWYLISGKKVQQPQEVIQRYLYDRLPTSRAYLALACCLLVQVLVIACLAIFFSESVVFIPMQEAGQVEVFLVNGDREESVGFASKDNPYRNRYFIGKKKFRFKTKDFKDENMEVSIEGHKLFGEDKHSVVKLLPEPKFKLVSIRLHADRSEKQANDLPEELRGLPSQILRFTIARASPYLFEITALGLQYDNRKEFGGWSFPYFGEAFASGAEPVKGYAHLMPVWPPVGKSNVSSVGVMNMVRVDSSRGVSLSAQRGTIRVGRSGG